MRNIPNKGSLRPLPPPGQAPRPLRASLMRSLVIRVEVPGQLPYWLAAGAAQKRELVARGAPAARVWTINELESLPWEEHPVTLESCFSAFQSPAPPEPTPGMPDA